MNSKIKASAMDSVVELSPKVKRSRSTFNLNIKHYTSFNLGDLAVVDFTEVIPGDTFNIDLSTFIRLTSPSKRAPMDSLHQDVYAFFVPYRFLDKAWVNIQGENSDPWAVVPGACSTLKLISVEAGSLANQLGLPAVTFNYDGNDPTINIYPFYAYYKIINDWFRDENLQAELAYDTTNGDYEYTDLPLINGKNCFEKGGLFKVAKYHDVFTSALPAPQKGPSVGLLTNNGKAPVGSFASADGTLTTNLYGATQSSGSFSKDDLIPLSISGSTAGISGNPIVADLSGSVLNTINELRLAFQLQKAYELDARSGTRYTEAIEARFSVKNPDLRLGRSELLGHYRFDLNMAEVNSNSQQGLGTSSTTDTLLGDTYNLGVGAGASKTANGQHICVKSFTEHGICMILTCVRPDLTYQQGIEKFWRKKTRFDFYEPIFSNIGEVPIMKSELFPVWDSTYGTENDSVFGYQEAWYEYRYKQNHISGILASDSNEGFDIFHYGQDFASAPVLGSTFIQQDNASLNRTLALGSAVVDNFIAQFVGCIKATRVMPLFSTPGLIDHF